MEVSDQALIRRSVKKGDKHAYSQLVRRYQSPLRYTLQSWCRGDHALAQDLAQETFIKAYRALPSFRGDAKFSTWLYRIAYNAMVNERRKKTPEAIADFALEGEHSAGMGCQGMGSHTMETEDVSRDVEAALAQLSESQQMAIHLCLQRGFSHHEAATIMNIPLGTVKTHILRGKRKLQVLLKSWRSDAK